MKTFTAFCKENLIKVIQEKRSMHMDISKLNLQTIENIEVDDRQIQLMCELWENELNLFYVHVNAYGLIYTNPFSNLTDYVFEAIGFGMTYLLRQSQIAKKHWDYPIDLADIADQMIEEISTVEYINFHEDLEYCDDSVFKSEFLEFGDRSSFKRVYEAGEGIYALFSKKGQTFKIEELPLYNPKLASTLMLKESEYHRLLILASIAHGHLNHLLESDNSYDFMNWSLEEFKERAKIETKFYGKGNLAFGGQVDEVKVDSFHHFNLIVDGQIFMHMTVESNNEMLAFPHILNGDLIDHF